MVAMPTTVSTMEEVHQWTQQQQKIWQNAKQMRGVFGDQEKTTDREEHEEHDVAARSRPVLRMLL